MIGPKHSDCVLVLLNVTTRSQTFIYSVSHFGPICMNCVTFTSRTPQILTIQFSLLRNARIFC